MPKQRFLPLQFQILIILLVGCVCYANSLQVPLQFDDFLSLGTGAANITLTDVLKTPRVMTNLTFALNRLLHGNAVVGYHLANLIIHLLATLLVAGLTRLIFHVVGTACMVTRNDSTFSFCADFVPFVTALLFLCHPLQTQAITYISQRYTSLATSMYLAASYAYLRARLTSDAGLRRNTWLWGCAAVLFAVLAMKSKEIAFTLPVMFVLLELFLFRGKMLKNPFLLAVGGALLMVIPLQMLSISGGSGVMSGLARASAEVATISRGDYFMTQLRVIITYLRLLVLPINQNLDYDFPLSTSIRNPQVIAALAAHLTLMLTSLWLVLKSRVKQASGDSARAAVMRISALGIAWFYLALSVESSIIPIRDYINEHRMYLPSFGILLALVTTLSYPAAGNVRLRKPLYAFVAVIICLLSVATILRNRVWKDELTLWSDTQSKSPAKARPNYYVGLQYYKLWRSDLAIPYLVRAIEIDPIPDVYWITLNQNIALLHRFNKRFEIGDQYQKNSHLVDDRYLTPWLAVSYTNLGHAYEYLGKLDLARLNFQRSVEFDPSYERGWYSLALSAARQKDQEGSAAALQRLRESNPALADRAVTAIRTGQNK